MFICDVESTNNISEALLNLSGDYVYIPQQRILLQKFFGSKVYYIYDFKTKLLTVLIYEKNECFFLKENILNRILDSNSDIEELENELKIEIKQKVFTDKDMLEPIETKPLENFSNFFDKKLLSVNIIKILKSKNVQAIIENEYTDDYAYDNECNFSKGVHMNKFKLINDIKKSGTGKGYRFYFDKDDKSFINGSLYHFLFFKITIDIP